MADLVVESDKILEVFLPSAGLMLCAVGGLAWFASSPRRHFTSQVHLFTLCGASMLLIAYLAIVLGTIELERYRHAVNLTFPKGAAPWEDSLQGMQSLLDGFVRLILLAGGGVGGGLITHAVRLRYERSTNPGAPAGPTAVAQTPAASESSIVAVETAEAAQHGDAGP